jgi:hypothetical protein
VKSQPPGALGFVRQHIEAPVLSMNSFLSNVAAATGLSKGLMKDADDQANHWLRMATDLAFPQLAPRPSEALGQAEFLARQRNAETQAPHLELKRQITDAIRDKDMDKAKTLVQQGMKDGVISRSDILESVKHAAVPATISQFSSLPIDAALEVMQDVTPEERAMFLKPLAQKLRREFPKMTPAEQQGVLGQLASANIKAADLPATH